MIRQRPGFPLAGCQRHQPPQPVVDRRLAQRWIRHLAQLSDSRRRLGQAQFGHVHEGAPLSRSPSPTSCSFSMACICLAAAREQRAALAWSQLARRLASDLTPLMIARSQT